MLSEYREVFLEELEEQLQLMDDVILQLEQEGETERVVQDLFRAAHTLKGSSAAMGYEEMKQLTHEMEHLLDLVRSRVLRVTGPLIDLFFQSLDCLKELQQDIMHNNETITDISKCVRDLQDFGKLPDEQAYNDAEDLPKPALSLDTTLKVKEAEDQGLEVYWVTVQIAADCVIKGARFYVIHSNLCHLGEVLYSVPDIDKIEVEEQGDTLLEVQFLYAGKQSSQELQDLVAALTEVEHVKVEALPVERAVLAEIGTRKQSESINEDPSNRDKSKTQTIRVSVERLDHLMNLVGELVIDHTRIDQVERTQRRQFTGDSLEELSQISDHLARIISDLQESVMKARMLPIEQLFNRFPRMIRDLSRDLGKDIELVIGGKIPN